MSRNRKKRKKNVTILTDFERLVIYILAVIGAVFVIVLTVKGLSALAGYRKHLVVKKEPELDVELLTPNPYSRSQIALKKVHGIVIHYTANPGTSAMENRNYFEGLKDSCDTSASSHFIVGLDGEVVQCIPTTEICYASNNRNDDTIAIECCHEDASGKFNDQTYDSAVYLTAWLCGKFNLTTKDVIRHYDITGKDCPKYYVEHEDAWKQFLADVDNYIKKNGTEVNEKDE